MPVLNCARVFRTHRPRHIRRSKIQAKRSALPNSQINLLERHCMIIAERHFNRARGDSRTRISKTKFLRYAGAVLFCLAVVLACAANAAAQQTIWPSTIVPATVDSGFSGPVELGVSFTADTSGTVTAIRFYKSAANTGLHAGHLWSRTGALLATVTFTGETSSGWQQANLSNPVAITANTVYVASYQTTIGRWSVNWDYFATSGVNNPPLHALQNGGGAPDGVYASPGVFPRNTYRSANFWVDVVFNSAAAVAPSITTQPASQTVTAGQTATFSVATTGTAPLTYQWKKNNLTISGANSSGYTTTATTSSDNTAQFTVTISNTAGTITSNPATLTVNVPPSITAQPASQTLTAGQTATFSVTATGTSPLRYQWQRNGTPIGGATSASYTTPTTTSVDNGAQFIVAVSNSAGSVNSNAAILTVNATLVAPAITTQPISQTVTAGQTAAFSVTASGTAPLNYQWLKNGGVVSSGPSASYTTAATIVTDTGAQFTVAVSNSAGSMTSNAATLTVNAAPVTPSITTQPASQTVTAGQTATFSVTASGTAPLNYQWLKNGAAVSSGPSASYTTPATTTADTGTQFTVAVSNSAGSINSSAATLTVNAAPVAPSITSQPASQTVTAGQTATFSVTASGTAPLNYQWLRNGAAVSSGPSASYTTPATTTADTGAQFTVAVSNSAGKVTSNAASLTVNAAPAAPSITSQPASQTVTAGQTATFSVTASGTAPLNYQWLKNGAAVSSGPSASYTTPATTTADTGTQFTVAVSNSAGSINSSAATLTVNAAPVAPSITSQPASQTVTAGQTATFSVTASGTAPLNYQWLRNGAAVSSGPSASYTT